MGSSDRGLYALRAGDGETIWRFETLGVVQCEPLYDPEFDLVYFGSHDGALYAVHARDGSILWRFMTGAEVARQPVIGGPNRSMLFVANGADQLFGLDRAHGQAGVDGAPHAGARHGDRGHAGPSGRRRPRLHGVLRRPRHRLRPRTAAERWTPVDLSAEAEQSAGDAPRYLDVDTTPIVDDLAATAESSTSRATPAASSRSTRGAARGSG